MTLVVKRSHGCAGAGRIHLQIFNIVYTRLSEGINKYPGELYALTKDYSRAENPAAKYPEKPKEMQDTFDSEARRNQVYQLAPA
jgi:hypothetical protein